MLCLLDCLACQASLCCFASMYCCTACRVRCVGMRCRFVVPIFRFNSQDGYFFVTWPPIFLYWAQAGKFSSLSGFRGWPKQTDLSLYGSRRNQHCLTLLLFVATVLEYYGLFIEGEGVLPAQLANCGYPFGHCMLFFFFCLFGSLAPLYIVTSCKRPPQAAPPVNLIRIWFL